MYLVFPRMPGESYRRWLRSLLLCLCDVFRSLINSLVCWFATRLHKSAPFISHHSTGKPGGGGACPGTPLECSCAWRLRLNFRRHCKMDLIRPCGVLFSEHQLLPRSGGSGRRFRWPLPEARWSASPGHGDRFRQRVLAGMINISLLFLWGYIW